jgi:hypothetical protein
VATVIDCPSARERDLAVLYLAGKLPEGETQAWERHYFGCENCWQDVQRGSELRAAFGKAPVLPRIRAVPFSRAWLALAAAAVLAIVGVGVWQLNRRTAEEPTVLRSAGAAIARLEVSARAGGRIDLSWAPQPQAATYEVQVFSSDSTRVWKTDTSEPRVSIVPGVVVAPGQTYQIRIEALDSLGQVIASGEVSVVPKQ